MNLLTTVSFDMEDRSPVTKKVENIEEEPYFEVPKPVVNSIKTYSVIKDSNNSEDELNYEDYVYRVATYLKTNGYVVNSVEDSELKEIIKLTLNISTEFDYIPSTLALSLIANESGFDRYCHSNAGAKGLCQIIPKYHEERLMMYVEDDDVYDPDLFFNSKLNVQTGLDYLSCILEETEGDITFALMWYNQGPQSAYDDYVEKGISSTYSQKVIALSEELEDIYE